MSTSSFHDTFVKVEQTVDRTLGNIFQGIITILLLLYLFTYLASFAYRNHKNN